MVQDEFLQFGDAAALNIKTKCFFMLHQLMWECCSSTTANKHYIYSLHWRALLSLRLVHHTVSLLTHWDMVEILMEPPVLKKFNLASVPQHPSSSHLHLVDVGWVVPAATQLGGSLTAAVRYLSAVCLFGANPDTLGPVGWTVAAAALELTGGRDDSQ